MSRKPKVRDLVRSLRAAGCRPVRIRGSHQAWRTPAGHCVSVVVNHAGVEVSRTVLSTVRRALRAEGIGL